ncbi:hypothetical protein M3Y95_01223000 [Aphelenchoides besseyi]|nr:hypothetical protein M3Y95_01223000 [Aphelenchoides besseyi]
MTSRLFNRTSSESSNRLDIDNIETSEENPHRLHDRRSRSPSRTPIESRNQHVSWHERIGQFVDVRIGKMLVLMTCLNFFYCSYLFATRSPVAGRFISFTFEKACEVHTTVKTNLFAIFDTINQLANETASWSNNLISQIYRN